MRIIPCAAVLLLMGAGPCSGDDDAMTDDAIVDMCAKYEPIDVTVARFQGSWVIDDATTNPSCSNSFMVTFEPWPYNPAAYPTDTKPVDCPGVFLAERDTKIKPCNGTVSGCPNEQLGRGLWVHPYRYNPDLPAQAQARLWYHSVQLPSWMETEVVSVVDEDHLQIGHSTKYTRSTLAEGTCE
jgi:hypothetical protein